MNIVYSSDENYAQHMAVSMISLMENNPDAEEINFFIFDNAITQETKTRLEKLTAAYCRNIHFIEFQKKAEELEAKINCPISISTYARLFIPEMLPPTCNKALYLDCDTAIIGKLTGLWNMEMGTASVGGVLDTLPGTSKKNIGLPEDAAYINAGVLLIDIAKWRKGNAQEAFMQYIIRQRFKIFYQDQGVINSVLKDKIIILKPIYNVMTPVLTTKYPRLVAQYRLNGFYSRQEIEEAKMSPRILHFTPEYVGRVWETGCLHPRKDIYFKYLNKTPWVGKIKPASPLSLKLQIIYWMERHLPVWLLHAIGC